MIRVCKLVIAALALLAAGCQPLAAPPPPVIERGHAAVVEATFPTGAERADCPFHLPGEQEGAGYRCGILRVPLDRSNPEGIQVGLYFAQLDALDGQAAQPPLLYFAGGPGASGVYDVPLLAPRLAPLRAERDLLFFDIRGAGFSQPRIDCAALADEGAGPACMAALRQQGIEPMFFNTTQNAADAADLVAALGYDAVDLLGVSYGTRLALEVLRTHPEIVRAAVLDSTVAPETLTYELQALGDYEAKIWPFAACEETPACRGRFGEMAGRFVALINRLDEDGPAAANTDTELDAWKLYNITALAVNQPAAMGLLPLVVDELDRGISATYTALRDGEFWGGRSAPAKTGYAFEELIPHLDAYLRTLPDADRSAMRTRLAELPAEETGNATLLSLLAVTLPPAKAGALRPLIAAMTSYERGRLRQYYGADLHLYDHVRLGDVQTIINCQEEIPFVDPEAVRKNQAVIPVPSLLPPYDFVASVRGEQRACFEKGLQPAPATFKDAVVSDKPVLLLLGTQDTVTPALWARLAAAPLTNAHLVTFPAYGHALLYNNSACTVEIVGDFLANPTRVPATSCIAPIEYALDQPLLVPLTGRMWLLQGWAGAAAGGLPATALFSGGRVSGLGGCSPYDGEFTLDDNHLSVRAIDTAADRCPDNVRALQEAFLAALEAAQSITIRGDRMLLNTAHGDLLVFTRQSDAALEGPVWTLVAAATGDGLVPVLPGADVTARFTGGGLMGSLGCNLYEAAYSVADGFVLDGLRLAGDAECSDPPGVMAQEQTVRALLEAVTSYRVVGRELFLFGEDPDPLLVFYSES